MEVLNFILIVVFLIDSVVVLTRIDYKDDIDYIKSIFFAITVILCLIDILDISLKLRDRDVFNNRAEYIETIHISKGDTIKTYHLQPKK